MSLSPDGRCAVGVLSASVVVLLGVSACGPTVCPAIGYSSSLAVVLADDWPDRDGLSLRVECLGELADVCGPLEPSDGPRWVAPLDTGPDRIAVTVLRDGGVVERVEADVEWRVEEYPNGRGCAGPAAAEVTVPAP